MLRLADSPHAGGSILGLLRDDLDPEKLSRDGPWATVASFAELLESPVEFIAAVGAGSLVDFGASAAPLCAELPDDGTALVILVPHKTPPLSAVRRDGVVDSFLASVSLLRALGPLDSDVCLAALCYRLLSAVANGAVSVDRLLVRQLPYEEAWRAPEPVRDAAAALIPHRGDIGHLETALRYVAKSRGMPVKARVGLDVDRPGKYERITGLPAEFYTASPAPAGPYVIRQELANRSLEPALVWLDSDDLPTTDRFATLWAEMQSTGCQIVGSQELRLDEMAERVEAWRYPLDVSAALALRTGDPILPATAMVLRSAFHRAGGLSTDQRIGNDTQFLLRASFSMKIRNSDAFLYIRRRHGESLTEALETGRRSPLRSQLGQAWFADFQAVQQGTLSLEQSSLRPMAGARHYGFERFPAAPTTIRWHRRLAGLIRKPPSRVASIIVPLVCQRDEGLEECLKSAIEQSAPVEVIVVTAGCTPRSNLEMVQRLAGRWPFLRAIPCDQAETLAGALNSGIRAASTGRLGLLFSGDRLALTAVERCLSQAADVVSIGQSSRPFLLLRRPKLLEVGGIDESFGDNAGMVVEALVRTSIHHGASVAVMEEPA